MGLVDRGRCAFAELLDHLIAPDLAHRGFGRADRAARERARGIDDERAAVGKRGGRARPGVGLVGPGTVLWIVSHESSPQPPGGSMVRKKIISPGSRGNRGTPKRRDRIHRRMFASTSSE